MKVAADSVVELDFIAQVLPEEKVVESTRGRNAVVVHLGRAQVAPGIQRALVGMGVGEEKTIDLNPEDGYGPVREEAIHRRRRDEFPSDVELKPGMRFSARLKNSQERVEFGIHAADDEEVVVDFNHPFAGREMRYWLCVRSVREPTADEREKTRWIVQHKENLMQGGDHPGGAPAASGAEASGRAAGQPEEAAEGRGAPAEELAPASPEVTIDDVMRLGLRVARVREAARVKGTDRLLQLTVDLGAETRTLVAGIAAKYEPDTLIGRSIIVVTNLKPAKIRGIESRGMLLAAVDESGTPILASFDEPVSAGAEVR